MRTRHATPRLFYADCLTRAVASVIRDMPLLRWKPTGRSPFSLIRQMRQRAFLLFRLCSQRRHYGK